MRLIIWQKIVFSIFNSIGDFRRELGSAAVAIVFLDDAYYFFYAESKYVSSNIIESFHLPSIVIHRCVCMHLIVHSRNRSSLQVIQLSDVVHENVIITLKMKNH